VALLPTAAPSRRDVHRTPFNGRSIDIDGFSLHAAVPVEAHDRKRLWPLCRHITRPALSDERVQRYLAGQGESKLMTPWRGGTLRLVTSPLQFMQRIAPVPVH
jgi:hypothetical protein